MMMKWAPPRKEGSDDVGESFSARAGVESPAGIGLPDSMMIWGRVDGFSVGTSAGRVLTWIG